MHHLIYSCTTTRDRSPEAHLRWWRVFGAPVAPLGSSGLPRGARHLDAHIPSPSRLAGRRPPASRGGALAFSVPTDRLIGWVGGSIPLVRLAVGYVIGYATAEFAHAIDVPAFAAD